MKVPYVRIAALIVAAAVLTARSPAQSLAQEPENESAEAPDLVFFNGKVITVNERFDVVEAIAVRGERLLAVGSNEEIRGLIGEGTESIDFEGRTVVPGLIDNHMHFVRAARDWYRHVRWDNAETRAEAFARVSARARSLEDGEWVVVIGGFSFEQFADDAGLFTLGELDALLPDRPLYIQEAYRRAFANSAALEAAGLIGAGAVEPARPEGIVTDDAGNPTGELRGQAMTAVAAAIPSVPDDVWAASLAAAERDMHAMGLTAVYDVGGNGVAPEHYRAVTRAADAGALTMRVFYTLNAGQGVGSSAEEIISALESREPDLDGLRFAQFGWGESTYEPMRAAPFRATSEVLSAYQAIAIAAAEHGWQLHEHSMGDDKIGAMLDVFERVDAERDISSFRWTIAHTNGISPASIERANALGVVYAVHSSARLSSADGRGDRPPPIRSIDASGGVWGLGSDSTTVASPNPFHNIAWAVTGLSPAGVRNLDETVSREAALIAHTRTNAYLLFREAHLGSLEAGKLADFAVLDRDYLTVPENELDDIRSVLTVVGGQVVYSEP